MDKKVIDFKKFSKKIKEIRKRQASQTQIEKINKMVIENQKEHTDEVRNIVIILGTLLIVLSVSLFIYLVV